LAQSGHSTPSERGPLLTQSRHPALTYYAARDIPLGKRVLVAGLSEIRGLDPLDEIGG